MIAQIAYCLAAGLAVAFADVERGRCNLNCMYNSYGCEYGPANFSNYLLPDGSLPSFLADEANVHCKCKAGWTGLTCMHQVKQCPNSSHVCFNGGECVAKDGCDCKRAIDQDGERYSGMFCERESVELCNSDREVFCVNGGRCKVNYQDFPNDPCDCNQEFEGRHCEFKKGESPTCDLRCRNGGTCQLGIETHAKAQAYTGFNDFWKNHKNLMYCSCKDGYHGARCEIERFKCGEKECFNGGTCVEKGLKDGSKTKHCDCTTTAANGDSSNQFAGRYCQYASSTFCSDRSNPNGKTFCVNGGECITSGTHFGCSCPDDYYGPICEFHKKDFDDDYAKCSLGCLNGGQCRKGAKDLSFLVNKGINASHLNIASNENNEHCICPTGYVGLRCEHKVEMCENNHVCLHGAQCVPGNDGYWECDCDLASTPFDKFAGKFCEHKATAICTNSGIPGIQGLVSTEFCVNNGECINVVGPRGTHKGCKCPEGFRGDHCEFSERQSVGDQSIWSSSTDVDDSSQESHVILVVAIAICSAIILFSVGGTIAFIWRRKRRKKALQALEAEQLKAEFERAGLAEDTSRNLSWLEVT